MEPIFWGLKLLMVAMLSVISFIYYGHVTGLHKEQQAAEDGICSA